MLVLLYQRLGENTIPEDKKITPQRRYDRDKTKLYGVKVVITTEKDIYDKLEATPNKSGYIKSLIKQDLEKERQK